MFKMCCGDCGECWWIGNARTCKCTDEKPVWDASASLVMTPNPAFAKRKWVGLTDEEIVLIVAECAASHQHTDIHFAKAIEAKLKQKNGYAEEKNT